MARIEGFLARVGRLPAALAELERHPGGLPLDDLARRVGADPADLREDLLAYYSADLPMLIERGQDRPFTLEFFSPDRNGEAGRDGGPRDNGDAGDDVEPAEATWVRVSSDSPLDEMGVTWLSAADAAALAGAAQAALELDATNAPLAAALERLHDVFLGGARGDEPADDSLAVQVRRACDERRRMRVTYSRTWRPGVVERVVDPYRLVRTARGWELDAGPLDDAGNPRTYLLSGIRALQVLDETFSPPDGLDGRLQAARAERQVVVRLPHNARWVAEFYAEEVLEIGEGPDGADLRLSLLPPVAERVGLILVTAGPAARVIQPVALAEAGRETARALLAAYGEG